MLQEGIHRLLGGSFDPKEIISKLFTIRAGDHPSIGVRIILNDRHFPPYDSED